MVVAVALGGRFIFGDDEGHAKRGGQSLVAECSGVGIKVFPLGRRRLNKREEDKLDEFRKSELSHERRD